ncbi:MAG: GNAT family N-acetyltransferase [Methanothrix sp.]
MAIGFKQLLGGEFIAIKASQKDSILEAGYLKGSGDSHEARSKYIIRFLTEYDLQDVIKLQEIVLHGLKDSEIYYPASQEKLKKYLSEKTFALGVLTGEGLIGFNCIHTPGDEQDNLGRDIGMSKEDLKKVAHIKFSFVHPDYRGNSFQLKLIKYTLDVINSVGCCHVLCTVSPKNYYSLRNMFQSGFLIKEITKKYGGLIRCILFKNICISAHPTWQDVMIIKSSDIEVQKKLLNEGFLGFNVSKDPNGITIHYGRSQTGDK